LPGVYEDVRHWNTSDEYLCNDDEWKSKGSILTSLLLSVSSRIAQLVKAWIRNLRIAGSSLTAGELFFGYGPLASLSFQIASVGSDHHAKKMEVPTSGLGSESSHDC